MIKQGYYTSVNPKLLALELYETFNLLFVFSDAFADQKELSVFLTAHMKRFIEINLAKETQRGPL